MSLLDGPDRSLCIGATQLWYLPKNESVLWLNRAHLAHFFASSQLMAHGEAGCRNKFQRASHVN